MVWAAYVWLNTCVPAWAGSVYRGDVCVRLCTQIRLMWVFWARMYVGVVSVGGGYVTCRYSLQCSCSVSVKLYCCYRGPAACKCASVEICSPHTHLHRSSRQKIPLDTHTGWKMSLQQERADRRHQSWWEIKIQTKVLHLKPEALIGCSDQTHSCTTTAIYSSVNY